MTAESNEEVFLRAFARMLAHEQAYAADPGAATLCHDCGTPAWGFDEDGKVVHEDFYVHNELWDSTCPDDDVLRGYLPNGREFGQGNFVLCIGCFETRLGRTLTRDDLAYRPFDLFGRPPSRRYVARWRTTGTPA